MRTLVVFFSVAVFSCACVADEARCRALAEAAGLINPIAVERAIAFLEQTYPDRYDAKSARAALTAYRENEQFVKAITPASPASELARAERLVNGVRAALLANPLLDADRIVYVRRILGGDARDKRELDWGSLSANFRTHPATRKNNWTSEIVELSDLRGAKKERVVKRFEGPLIRDLKLTFDATAVTYTGVDANNRFAVYSLPLSGNGEPVTISPKAYPDIDWFDGVLLPDGRYVMLSTAGYQGLPCENGSQQIAQIYLVDPSAKTNMVRQLTFEQDSDYTPSNQSMSG